jgi:hypothetical protein
MKTFPEKAGIKYGTATGRGIAVKKFASTGETSAPPANQKNPRTESCRATVFKA